MTNHDRLEPMRAPEPVTFTDEGDSDLDQSDTHPTRFPAVAVSVEGIARVRSLPSRRAILGSVPVPNDGTPVRLVGRVDQRLSVLIQPAADVQIFAAEPAADSTAGFPLAGGTGFGLDYTGELWAVNTGAALTIVGVVQTLTEE